MPQGVCTQLTHNGYGLEGRFGQTPLFADP